MRDPSVFEIGEAAGLCGGSDHEQGEFIHYEVKRVRANAIVKREVNES